MLSTLMPGPIVELIAIFRTYLPLAPDGLALTIASTNASKFALQVFRREARLADAGVDDARLLDAELDLAALGVLDGLGRRPW